MVILSKIPVEKELEKEKEIELEEEVKEDKKTPKRFAKPTLTDIQNYCIERKNNVDPQRFYDYYESNGWKVGKNSMKDWKAAVRTWERSDNTKQTKKSEFSDISQKVRERNKAVSFDYIEADLDF